MTRKYRIKRPKLCALPPPHLVFFAWLVSFEDQTDIPSHVAVRILRFVHYPCITNRMKLFGLRLSYLRKWVQSRRWLSHVRNERAWNTDVLFVRYRPPGFGRQLSYRRLALSDEVKGRQFVTEVLPVSRRHLHVTFSLSCFTINPYPANVENRVSS